MVQLTRILVILKKENFKLAEMITSLLFFVFNVIDMKNWTNSLSRFSFHYRIQIFLLNVNAENGGCNAENLFKTQEHAF